MIVLSVSNAGSLGMERDSHHRMALGSRCENLGIALGVIWSKISAYVGLSELSAAMIKNYSSYLNIINKQTAQLIRDSQNGQFIRGPELKIGKRKSDPGSTETEHTVTVLY